MAGRLLWARPLQPGEHAKGGVICPAGTTSCGASVDRDRERTDTVDSGSCMCVPVKIGYCAVAKLLTNTALGDAMAKAKADYQRPLSGATDPAEGSAADLAEDRAVTAAAIANGRVTADRLGTPDAADRVARLAAQGLAEVDGKIVQLSSVNQPGWSQEGVSNRSRVATDAETLPPVEPVSPADRFRELTASSNAERVAASGLHQPADIVAAFTTPSAQIAAAAARGDLPAGQAELMGRVSKSGLDGYYEGPVPQELLNRRPYLGLGSRGALVAHDAKPTDPLAGVPAQPPQPVGPYDARKA